MASIKQIPLNSNRYCMGFLNRASMNSHEDKRLRQNPYLAPWFDRIEELVEAFRQGMETLYGTNATLILGQANRNDCALMMERLARDFQSSLKRWLARNEQPDYVANLFVVPNGLSRSEVTSSEDWYQFSQWLVKGEEKAREAGFPITTSPTVEELAECRDAFVEKRRLADSAERSAREARATMQELRKEVQIAARGLSTCLRLVLHKEGETTIRETLRGYGFTFRSSRGGEPLNRDDEQPAVEPTLDPSRSEPLADPALTREVVTNPVVTRDPAPNEAVAREPTNQFFAPEPVPDQPVAREQASKQPIAPEPVADDPLIDERFKEVPLSEEDLLDLSPAASTEDEGDRLNLLQVEPIR